MPMKKINCLIVDDEPLAIELLENHLQQFTQFHLVTSCWNAIQAFEVLKREQIDLVFLDIQMPGMTGIEFVKSIANPPSIIFTTAYRDYAVESYELDVVDYLVKPITIDRFLKAVNRYFDKREYPALSSENRKDTTVPIDNFLYVNTNRKHVKVSFEEVLYIESLKDYVGIQLPNEEVKTKDKISDFEKKLPDYFMRVHRSFIINTKKITAFTTHDIEICKNEIPIGISYKKEVMAFLARQK